MIRPITPDWPAPARVRAFVTTREGGVSSGAYASLNLALHRGDAVEAVMENRARLDRLLPSTPVWLHQVHRTGVVDAGAQDAAAGTPEGDACITSRPNTVCAVLVADCMPVFLADREGTAVGIAHAGWRGLASGVIEATVASFSCPPSRLVAWLGPGIGPHRYEVGDEVRAAFVARDAASASAFTQTRAGRWRADLYALARQRLGRAGVPQVAGGAFCTYSEPERFFSYRRDPRTGRMAALAWLE